MFFLNLIICYLCSKYLLDNIGWMFIFISIVSCLLSLFRYRYPVFLFFVIISGFLTYDYPVNFIFIAMLIFIFKLEGDYREYLVDILSGVFSIIFVLVFFGGGEYAEHFIIIILFHWVVCNMIYQKRKSFSAIFLALPILWFIVGVFIVFLLKKLFLI